MTRTPYRLGLTLGPLALVLGLAACEPTDGSSSGSQAAPPELLITGTDYAFAAPADVPAGMTQVTIKNDGKELHQAAVVQLAEGKAFTDFVGAMEAGAEALPEWATVVGGPAVAAPTQSASAFVDLAAGNYVLICNIPNAEGTPHSALGMLRPMTVSAASGAAAAAPAGDETITGTDFAFAVPATLPTGEHVLSFKNDGQQPHEAVLVKLDEGAKVADVAAAFAPGASGQPPAMPVGGIAGLMPGSSQSFPASLTPGRYGLLCFYPDAATGKAHAELGMMTEFSVQ